MARRRATIRSGAPPSAFDETRKSPPTCGRSSPTAFATASAWPSIRFAGQLVDAGQRRRYLRRDPARRRRAELGMDSDDRPDRARRRVQVDRDDAAAGAAAAAALAADEPRRRRRTRRGRGSSCCRAAHYRDPQFSWRYAVAPAGIGFVRGLGPRRGLRRRSVRRRRDAGARRRLSVPLQSDRNRRDLHLDDPGLADHVADNNDKNDITESESLLAGRNFGVSTDIQTGPNGNLFVVSLTRGEMLEISRVR